MRKPSKLPTLRVTNQWDRLFWAIGTGILAGIAMGFMSLWFCLWFVTFGLYNLVRHGSMWA